MPERSCLYPIPEIKRRLGGIGTTKLYDMVKRGDLRLVKIGSRSFATGAEIERCITELEGAS